MRTRLQAIFWACVLAACATVDATSTRYVGVPSFPATDAAKVQILRAEPARAVDRIGEIAVDASTDPAPPVEDIEKRLREEAAKLGASAVQVVSDRIGPYGGRRVIGIVIRYR